MGKLEASLEKVSEEINLSKMREKRLKERGIIIVADDVVFVHQSISCCLKRLNALDQTEFYTNGQQVIDRVKELTNSALHESKSYPICPVRLLLLDFQMPYKNGLDVVTELKNYYNHLIEKHDMTLTADMFI